MVLIVVLTQIQASMGAGDSCRGSLDIPDGAAYPRFSMGALITNRRWAWALFFAFSVAQIPAHALLGRSGDVAPTLFGVYHWGGGPGSTAMADGVRIAMDQMAIDGLTVARIVIGPKMRNASPDDNPYRLDFSPGRSGCPVTVAFLPCVIRLQAFQAAISQPSMRTVVLTAYDSASSGPSGGVANYLDPGFWQDESNRAAVRNEFRDLTFALYQTQRQSGKRFILASWEADNQAYCGSVTSYVADEGFRARCGNAASRDAAIQALTEWFKERRAGISEGKAMAARAGYDGVQVHDAVEFNVNTLTYTYEVHGSVLRSALRDIAPQVKPDYLLYSAYDSQNRGSMEQDLRSIREWMQKELPSSVLAVGEFGFPLHGRNEVDAFRTVETAKAIQRVGLPFAIVWSAFDVSVDGRSRPYGVFDDSGQPREVLRMLQRALREQPLEIARDHIVFVRSVSHASPGFSDARGPHGIFLSGTFPTSSLRVTGECDGRSEAMQLQMQSLSTARVLIPQRAGVVRFCTLRIHRSDGSGRSLDVGPIRVPAE